MFRLCKLPKEPLEAGWRKENQVAPCSFDDAALRMRNSTRSEHDVARPDRKFVVTDAHYMLAFKHIPKLVFILMNVKRGVDGVDFLDDAEGPTRGSFGSPYDDLDSTEVQSFTTIVWYVKGVGGLRHGWSLVGLSEDAFADRRSWLPHVRELVSIFLNA